MTENGQQQATAQQGQNPIPGGKTTEKKPEVVIKNIGDLLEKIDQVEINDAFRARLVRTEIKDYEFSKIKDPDGFLKYCIVVSYKGPPSKIFFVEGCGEGTREKLAPGMSVGQLSLICKALKPHIEEITKMPTIFPGSWNPKTKKLDAPKKE